MKVISLNKNIGKYNFLNEIEYRSPNFFGHQTGILIGILSQDEKWDKLGVPGETEEEKVKLANEILADKSLIIVEEKITQIENNNLVPKKVYYLPYYVEEHTAFKPTINYTNISNSSNVKQTITYEILLVDDWGCNRYITKTIVTGPVGFNGGQPYKAYDFMHSLELEIQDMIDNNDYQIRVATSDGEEYSDGDILIDFYDEKGSVYTQAFSSIGGVLDTVVSIRIVGYDSEIVNLEELTKEQ